MPSIKLYYWMLQIIDWIILTNPTIPLLRAVSPSTPEWHNIIVFNIETTHCNRFYNCFCGFLGQGSQRNLKPHGPAITLIGRTMKSPAARNPLFPFTDGSRQDTPSSSSSSSLLRRANNSSQTSRTQGGNGISLSPFSLSLPPTMSYPCGFLEIPSTPTNPV